jgi:predicted dehydrogenase
MNFAIIGCGLIGHKRAKSLYNHKLLYACDVDFKKSEELSKLYNGCIPTTNINLICNDINVDVAIVSVINNQLYPIALQLIKHSKHVLIEKPGSITVYELIQLQKAASKSGSIIRVGYNHRYHSACIKINELVDNCKLGSFMFLRGRYGHGGRIGYETEWRSDKTISGGGELIDQGVHLIDLASIFMGEYTQIDGHINTYYWKMDVEDNAFLSLKNNKNNTAWLHVSCTEWKNIFSLEIYFKYAKLHWEGLGGSYGVEKLHYYKMTKKMGPPDTIIYEYPRQDDSWKIEIEEFINDIVSKRVSIPGIKEAINALTVVETIYNKTI